MLIITMVNQSKTQKRGEIGLCLWLFLTSRSCLLSIYHDYILDVTRSS